MISQRFDAAHAEAHTRERKGITDDVKKKKKLALKKSKRVNHLSSGEGSLATAKGVSTAISPLLAILASFVGLLDPSSKASTARTTFIPSKI